MDDLQKRFDSLPPELRNMISDYTFCASSALQHITTGYKPPSALQVSSVTRETFAASYYELTTFKASAQGLLRGWLLSLLPQHYAQIKTIHFDLSEALSCPNKARNNPKANKPSRNKTKPDKRQHPYLPSVDPDVNLKKRASARLFFIQHTHGKRWLRLRDGVLHVNVKFSGMEEEVWTTDAEKELKKWREQRNIGPG